MFPATLTPTTDARCGTRAVLRTPYNSSFEFYTTTNHYTPVKIYQIQRREIRLICLLPPKSVLIYVGNA